MGAHDVETSPKNQNEEKKSFSLYCWRLAPGTPVREPSPRGWPWEQGLRAVSRSQGWSPTGGGKSLPSKETAGSPDSPLPCEDMARRWRSVHQEVGPATRGSRQHSVLGLPASAAGTSPSLLLSE